MTQYFVTANIDEKIMVDAADVEEAKDMATDILSENYDIDPEGITVVEVVAV